MIIVNLNWSENHCGKKKIRLRVIVFMDLELRPRLYLNNNACAKKKYITILIEKRRNIIGSSNRRKALGILHDDRGVTTNHE